MATDVVLGETTIELVADGLVLRRGDEDPQPIRLQIRDGNVLLGGEGSDGDLLLYDRAGNLTIGLNGETGSLHLGGQSEDGDIVVRDGSGEMTAHLDGATGHLDLAGDVHAESLVNPSDARLKTDISGIAAALATVRSLAGVEFRYRREGGPTGRLRRGFVADEVEMVLPDAVTRRSDGMRSLHTLDIVPILLEAVKELAAQVEALRAKASRVEVSRSGTRSRDRVERTPSGRTE